MTFDYFKRRQLNIAAPASALGGPVAVIRVSGSDLGLLTAELGLGTVDERRAQYRKIFDVDRAVIIFFKGPRSFTGEDVLELQVHGSDRICEKILAELRNRGVVPALPGEFSFRAFINNKLTLAEAESLNLALGAASASPLASQLLDLPAHTKKKTEEFFIEVEEALRSARGRLESAIDFSEAEEEQSADVLGCSEHLKIIERKLDKFLTNYEAFRFSLSEARILIVGEPNAGKSSLFNLLLGSDRSLVSDRPGTTRDYIEARVILGQRPYLFVDTAGLRDCGEKTPELDEVERRGIDLARGLMKEAHALIWVQASDQVPSTRISEMIQHPRVIVVQSFGDRSGKLGAFDLRNDAMRLRQYLTQELSGKLSMYREERQLECFLSERQVILLGQVRAALSEAQGALLESRPLELVADGLRDADRLLKMCVGQDLSDDYISEIFRQFCLGK